jgi:hypothetical protein
VRSDITTRAPTAPDTPKPSITKANERINFPLAPNIFDIDSIVKEFFPCKYEL